jgi:phytoene dehydrogenase-like protein
VFTTGLGQVAEIAGSHLPSRFAKRLQAFPPGPGAFKLDYALDSPIPWSNPDVANAATVHLGGTLEEIIESEAAASSGRPPERPFVLLAQHTLFDPTRAPAGKHTAWAYCHVPNGSPFDMTNRIEDQIERFAPGFRQTVIARRSSSPADLEASNANLVGGDVAGGSNRGTRVHFRPWPRTSPYTTPDPTIFIGSAATSPGAGAHGMSGHLAARKALETLLS